AVRVEVDDGAAGEHQRDGRYADLVQAGEVEARVENAQGLRPRVPRHPGSERRRQRRVRRRRQPRDHRAGVHQRPGGEHRRRQPELLPAHGDVLQGREVVRRDLLAPEHRRRREPRRAAAAAARRRAQREEPRRGRRRREAVEEGLAVPRRRLRHRRLRVAAEADEAVGLVVHAGAQLGVAAPELEAPDDVGAGQRQHVGAVRPGCVRAVAVLDDVLAPRLGVAAVGLAAVAELRARGGAAVERRVRARRGRVEQRAGVGVARRRGGARLALHPRHVAAGVDDHPLRHRRRAEPDGDDVLQRVQGGAQRGRHGHLGRLAVLAGGRAVAAGELASDVVSSELVTAEQLLVGWPLLAGVGIRRRAWAVPVAQRH
ncbi:Os01g0608200, partial [Oryza sativa Japonica Group]